MQENSFAQDDAYKGLGKIPVPELLSDERAPIPLSDLDPVLIVSPHPDDETLGCGGLIAHCARKFYPVCVLAMTDGNASHPGDDAWRKALGETRRGEQRNALKALGLSHPDVISLALPDGQMEQLADAARARAVESIRDIIRSRKPRSVFVPAIDDCHGDHRETARLVLQAVRTCPVEYLFSYQIWSPEERRSHILGSEVTYSHDISALLPLKQRAVEAHRSQLGVTDPDHPEGFRMPRSLLEAKLNSQESYALVSDLAAWGG